MKRERIYFLATNCSGNSPENAQLKVVESRTKKQAIAEQKKKFFSPRDAENMEVVDFFSFPSEDDDQDSDEKLTIQTIKGLIALGHDEEPRSISSYLRELLDEIYRAGIRQGKKLRK